MARKAHHQENSQNQENTEADLVALSEQPRKASNLPNGETEFMLEDAPRFESIDTPEPLDSKTATMQQSAPYEYQPPNSLATQNDRNNGNEVSESGRQNMQTQPDPAPKQASGQQDMNFSQFTSANQRNTYINRNNGGYVTQLLNMSDVKQWFSLLGGVYLAIYGLSRSLGSLTVAGAGVGLVYYAVTGRWPLADRISSVKTRQGGASTASAKGALSALLNTNESTNTQNILVKAPLQDVYQAWANFENFPNFMRHIKQVDKTGDRTSHWVMEGPLNTKIEWDAETTRLDENKRIAWNSITGDIKTSGQVTFNELPDNQVEVTVMLKYVPPAGLAGEIVAELFGSPEVKLLEDLRNFKRTIESQRQPA